MSEFFFNDPSAPAPSLLHLGTAIAIFHNGRLLLDHRADGCRALFGGAMELGESIEQCVRREIREELNLELGPLRLVGTFSDPSRIIRFPDDRVVQSISIVFAADWNAREWKLSDESFGAEWVAPADIDLATIAPTHRMIIPHLAHPERWPLIL